MKKIVVDPPVSEARRERVERQLFQQLAAVRAADRADAVIPKARKNRAPMLWAFAGFAAAAVAIFLFITRDGEPGGQTGSSPSRVVSPVDRDTQFTIGHEAVVVAKADTSVEWQRGGDGSITLTLERGAVDCQVEPRHGKAPFMVVADDIKVVVVGTRFTVTRTPTKRVDVAHGKVRVEAPGGTWYVEAGESWTPMTSASAEPVRAPVAEPAAAEDEQAAEPTEIEMDPVKVSRTKKPTTGQPAVADKATPGGADPTTEDSAELTKRAYFAANRLEASDPTLAAANYRAIANGKDPRWAATALVSLAELELKQKHPKAALELLDEHAHRFPRSIMREDAAWDRIEALRAMGKRDEARGAAADYLREFPDGTYADRVAPLTK